MKKQLVTLFSLLLTLCLLCTLFSACGKQPQSAYDLAVLNGFVGTEEQWLASLQGKNLEITDIYTKAVEEGYTGDFLTFLSEYLKLDADMLAEAILNYQSKDLTQMIAASLLSSVEIKAFSPAASTGMSAGSGVIYSLDKANGNAYIITNHHVVSYTAASGDSAIHQSIQLYLYGSPTTTAHAIKGTYIGGSDTYDLAVLKVNNSEILQNSSAIPIAIADSDLLMAGQGATAIGNAGGYGISVTNGIVSVASKDVELSPGVSRRLIQIDTPVNEGNSGGGLFDKNGRLIGIVTAKIESANIDSIAYAIPSNIAVRIASNLIDTFESEHGDDNFLFEGDAAVLKVTRLGITLSASNSHAVFDEEREITILTEDVVIDAIENDSIALSMGLKKGDVITKITIDGTAVDVLQVHSLTDAMFLCRRGSTIVIDYVRDDVAATATGTATSFVAIP